MGSSMACESCGVAMTADELVGGSDCFGCRWSKKRVPLEQVIEVTCPICGEEIVVSWKGVNCGC